MAEGLARELGKGFVEAYSAGVMTADVQPRAIAVMKEIGIDISRQRSKLIAPELLKEMDFLISLCDYANNLCPQLPGGVKKLHWPIKDPVGTLGTEQTIMQAFRRARDDIKQRIIKLFEEMEIIKESK